MSLPSFVAPGFQILVERRNLAFNNVSILTFGFYSGVLVLGGTLELLDPISTAGDANMVVFGTLSDPDAICATTNFFPQKVSSTRFFNLSNAETYFVKAGKNFGAANRASLTGRVIAELFFMRVEK